MFYPPSSFNPYGSPYQQGITQEQPLTFEEWSDQTFYNFAQYNTEINLTLTGDGNSAIFGDSGDYGLVEGNNNLLSFAGGDDFGGITEGSNNGVMLGDGRDLFFVAGETSDNNSVIGGKGDDFLILEEGSNVFLSGGEGDDIISVFDGDNALLSGGEGDDVLWIQGGSNTIIKGGEGVDTIMLYGSQEDWNRIEDGNKIKYQHMHDDTSFGFDIDIDDYTNIENIGFTNGSKDPNLWSFIDANAAFENISNTPPVTQTFEQELEALKSLYLKPPPPPLHPFMLGYSLPRMQFHPQPSRRDYSITLEQYNQYAPDPIRNFGYYENTSNHEFFNTFWS